MTDRIGIGMIGLGMAVKPHALSLKELAHQADFVGGFSPSEARRSAFGQTYDLPTVQSVDELLDAARRSRTRSRSGPGSR